MELAPGSTMGNYRITRLLGRGGMGEVYLAVDQNLHRDVALKVLPPEFERDAERVARFRREATLAAALNHPNICTIHEINNADGRTFIAMEYVEGATLRERIQARPMEIGETLDIGIQIADALDEARKRNIVHRDIKSTNILLTSRNQAKVLDFGLAKAFDAKAGAEGATATELTQPGGVVGTVSYMSPEQALGKPLDHRSDIFSFGVVLYEMVTGRLPFAEGSSQEILNTIVNKNPPSIARYNEKTPDELIRIVNKMLEKDRELRYQSAREVWADLRRLRGDTSVKIQAVPKRPAARKGRLFGIAAVLAAPAVAAAAVFWLGRGGMVPVAEANSVVVLPCRVMGPEAKDAEWLSEAFSGSVSALLGKVEGLETKAPPTKAEFDSVQGNLDKIEAAFKVKFYVQPSVIVESDQLVFNVLMVESKSRVQLASMHYEGGRKDYNELARRAADDLRRQLRPAAAPVTSTGLAANSQAELLFRQAKYYSNQYNNLHHQPDFDRALSGLRSALELDPRLADAAAEIAWIFEFRAEAGGAAQEALHETELWAHRAIEIDPQCGLGWEALAAAEAFGSHLDRRRILEYCLKAAYLAPREPMVHNGLGNAPIGITLQLAAALEAHRLDALYLYGGINAASALFVLGRSAEGLPYLDEVLAIEPNHMLGLLSKSYILADLGHLAEARDAINRAQGQIAEGSLMAPWVVFVQYVLALEQGDSQAAAPLLQKTLKTFDSPQTPSLTIEVGTQILLSFLARHGQSETALHILTRDLETGLNPVYDRLVLDPRLEPLRRDDRFKPIFDKSRKDFEEMMKVLEQARSRGEFPRYLEAPLADLIKKLNLQDIR